MGSILILTEANHRLYGDLKLHYYILERVELEYDKEPLEMYGT